VLDSDGTLSARLTALGVSAVRPLAGGASSLTYQGEYGGERVVVKVAPAGHAPVGHRDVLRQAAMISALGPTDVPVPAVRCTDAGAAPDVPPLFVMTMVDGEAFEPLFDSTSGPSNAIVAQRYRHAAGTLARLHRLSPNAVGAGAEPVVDAAAEVDRWCATLRTVEQALVPRWSDVAARLRATVPAPLRPSVVHGDFRLGNLLADGADVTAVIDWEIWSVGDPRIDLGWFLVNADPATYGRATGYVDAVPPIADLVSYYADAFGAEVPDVPWFMALACFKSAATWGLIVKHNRRRPTPQPDLEAMASVLAGLLSTADAYVG
jgi:aminoglycoside phosphotransferase (APT) family kinase protein